MDPRDLLVQLAGRGLNSVMVEGGPRLAATFLGAGLVDRWLHYQAPRVLGDGVGWPDGFAGDGPVRNTFSFTDCRHLGEDLLTVYDRNPFRAVLGRVTL